jgi:peptide/nickel transport system permease protein
VRTIGFKLIRLVIVVLVVTFICFWLLKLSPDDLVDKIIPVGSEAAKNKMRADIGLNDGFFMQYWHWLSHFFTGNFGYSYLSETGRTPVGESVRQSLPISLELMLGAQILALVIAIPFGVVTAYRAGSKFDGASNSVAFGMLALPSYVLGFVLLLYVGAKWKLLPTAAPAIDSFSLNPLDNWRYMLMPVISLAVGQIAIYMRLLRSDMIATLQEDFVTTAKSKGITDRRVLFRHALRPSSLTLLTVAGLNVGALIGGALVIEQVFSIPGIGSKLAQSILTNQLVAVQSYVAIIAIFYVVLNFFVDITYSYLDPRIRHARAAA